MPGGDIRAAPLSRVRTAPIRPPDGLKVRGVAASRTGSDEGVRGGTDGSSPAQSRLQLDQNRVLPTPQSPAQPLLSASQTRSISAQSRLKLKQRPLRMEAVTGTGEKKYCVRLNGYLST